MAKVKKKILWLNKTPSLLISKEEGEDLWLVINGAWDLRLNEDTLIGQVIWNGKEIQFERITDAPTGSGYNEILHKALLNG